MGRKRLAVLVAVIGVALGLQSLPASAATPWSGTLTLTGSGVSYTSNQSTPTFQASVSPYLTSGYYLSVYDDFGRQVCTATFPYNSCSASLSAPLNSSRSYTAYVAYGTPPTTGPPANDVRAVSNTVVVTKTGWAGEFTSAHATAGDQAFLGATSARFEWDQPLEFVHVDVLDSHGEVIGSCNTVGSLDCTVALALGPDESEIVHAAARANFPGGGFEIIASSGSVELTGMDTSRYAEFLMNAPEASVVAMVGTARAQQALQVRTVAQSETFCVWLGGRFPTNAVFRATVPDVTLVCGTGKVALLVFLAAAVGFNLALDIMAYDGSAEPEPDPEPDPIVPGGPNDPPAPAVDTCQIPPGQDPDTYYFYQRTDQMTRIEATGIREVGSEGKIWLGSVLYSTAAEAQAELALPDTPPDGYYEVPAERLENLYGPYCVSPDFGQPGGGIEYWTTQPINMEGLTWHPMS